MLRLPPQNKAHATFMQPFQCDLQPQLQETHRTTHTRTTIVAKHIEGTKRPQPQPPHTRGTFHRRLQPLYTEKHKVSCSGFLPTTHSMQHACAHSNAIRNHSFKKRIELRTQEQPLLQNTRRDQTTAAATAAHTRYLSSLAAATLHGKTPGFVLRLPPQNIAHATFMQPFQCDLQPQLQETHRNTHRNHRCCKTHRRNQTTAAAPVAQTRYLSSPAAATLHRKTQGFVLRLPPQNIAHATCMQPLHSLPHHFPSSTLPIVTAFPSSPLPIATTSPHHHFPSSPLPLITTSLPHHVPSSPLPFLTTSLRHHFPSSPPSFLTTSLRHHFPSSPLPLITTSLPHHFPSSPLPFLTTSLRHHFQSSPLPFLTTSLRHHFPPSPLPFLTTSLPHHFPSSPLPAITTSLPHHFPSSPLPIVTTSLPHHFPSSPLPIVTTSLPHHFPSSPLPFLTTSLPHHFPSSPPPFLTTPLHHHFPSSPLPFLTTSHRNHIPS